MKNLNKILLIIFLLVFNIVFYIVNNNQSCDKCEITFTQTKMSGVILDNPRIYSYSPFELYNSLLNNSCIITWDRTGGYHSEKQPNF
jgi:hypothetical protein